MEKTLVIVVALTGVLILSVSASGFTHSIPSQCKSSGVPRAKLCALCMDEVLEDRPDTSESTKQKIPILAGAMSFCWPGLGQFYNGQVGKGLLHMSVFMTSFVLGHTTRNSDEEYIGKMSVVVLLSIFVWSQYDAYTTAKKINQEGSGAGDDTIGLKDKATRFGLSFGVAGSETRAMLVLRF